MGKIRVDTSVLDTQALKMDQMAARLEKVSQNVKQTANGISREISSVENLRSRILESAEKINKLGGRQKAAAKSLKTVASRYVKAEERVGKTTAKKTGKLKKNGAKETISKTLQDCFGTAVKKGKKAVKSIKKSYDGHGWAYKTYQYGKAAFKVGKAVVKIAGAVGAIASVVGIPIAVLEIVSAGNDIINGFTDIELVHQGFYDDVGKYNCLKDYLTKNGKKIGAYFGNEEMGEWLGKLTYYGIDLVTFLDGADSMLKNLGKANTVITGTSKSSWVWGETDWDAVIDNEIEFDFTFDYFIRKVGHVDGSSTGNILYEAGKSIYKTVKSSLEIGEEYAGLFLK